MGRHLTEADRLAWAGYTLHVRAFKPVAQAPAASPATPGPPAAPAIRPVSPRPRAMAAPVQIGTAPAGLDKGTWSRFRSGKLAPARTLDLHGQTAQRAWSALHGFLRGAHDEGIRCVEIVTGRGQGEGGVLRRELPHWLNGPELRPIVLAASHPHAANPGSVIVLLRRVRGHGAKGAATES